MIDMPALLAGSSAMLCLGVQGLLTCLTQLGKAAALHTASPAASTGLQLHAWPPLPGSLAPCMLKGFSNFQPGTKGEH